MATPQISLKQVIDGLVTEQTNAIIIPTQAVRAATRGGETAGALTDVAALLKLLGYTNSGFLEILMSLYAILHAVFDHPATQVLIGGATIPVTPANAPKVSFEPGGVDPRVCIDGKVMCDGKTYDLWARRRIFNNHAAINGETVPGGLMVHGEIRGAELALTLTFDGSQPLVKVLACATLQDLGKALFPVLGGKVG